MSGAIISHLLGLLFFFLSVYMRFSDLIDTGHFAILMVGVNILFSLARLESK
jgi:hypothetical protein